jgi:hypothetical protein
MSISSIGGSNGFDPTQMAKEFFKKADTNSDGGIDKAELKTMLSNKPGGSKGAQDIDKIFAEVDTNSDGKIDETENANQMKKMGGKGGKPPGGMPPSGGAPKAAAPGTSSSNSNKIYDKKDTNKDGTVSFQEELDYDLKHPEEAKENQLLSSTNKQKNSVGYNQQGDLNAGESDTQGMFSLNA